MKLLRIGPFDSGEICKVRKLISTLPGVIGTATARPDLGAFRLDVAYDETVASEDYLQVHAERALIEPQKKE